MKAFILAAGFGKRMGALTRDLPKPLLPVDGRPLLEYTLFQLFRWKCEEAVINVHYLPDAIADYLRDFRGFPVHISREKEILGTAGGLRNALKYFENEKAIIMINPDTIFLPHAWDRPEIPVKDFTPDTAACLFLAEKPAHSRERGWNFDTRSRESAPAPAPACDARDVRPIRHDESGGRYFYNGYSIINPAAVRELEPGFLEFGPVWVEQAEQGRVLGKVYRGATLDAGTREPYEQLRDRDIIPEDARNDWERFIAQAGSNFA